MEKYEIKSLESTSLDELTKAHNEAFGDYIVPMQTTAEQLAAYCRVSGVDLARSFGAFCEGQLVGFLLNAIDTLHGETVAYDAMTGIVPPHRGGGLFSRLFSHTRQCLKQSGIAHYYLDVITTNSKAVAAYKSKGGQVTREFAFFTGSVLPGIGTSGGDSIAPKPLSIMPAEDLCRYTPSFGNRMAALRRDVDNYRVAQCQGVAVVFSRQGRVCQIRYGGLQDTSALYTILGYLCRRYEEIKVSNIPLAEEALLHALRQSGLENSVNQCEMRMEL